MLKKTKLLEGCSLNSQLSVFSYVSLANVNLTKRKVKNETTLP